MNVGRSPGLRAFVVQQLQSRPYREWIEQYDTLTATDRAAIASRVAALPPRLISVVMPVYNPRERWLAAAIESVRGQLYPHWELCIADDASTAAHVPAVLAAAAARDTRIKVVRQGRDRKRAYRRGDRLGLAWWRAASSSP